MNLRVRRVTAESAMFATVSPEICLRARVVTGVGLLIVDGGRSRCRRWSARKFVLVTRNRGALRPGLPKRALKCAFRQV